MILFPILSIQKKIKNYILGAMLMFVSLPYFLLVFKDVFRAVLSHSVTSNSVHGILQARILGWVAMPSSRGSSQPRSPTLQADSLPSKLLVITNVINVANTLNF